MQLEGASPHTVEMEGTAHVTAQSSDRWVYNFPAPLYHPQEQENRYHPPGNQPLVDGELQNDSNSQYNSFMLASSQGPLYGTMDMPISSNDMKVSVDRRSGRRGKFQHVIPAEKRQKVFDDPVRVKRLQDMAATKLEWDNLDICNNQAYHLYSVTAAGSVTGSRVSECCSSCSEGLPCDEPDCDKQKEAVVPCNKESCDVPVCPQPCLPDDREKRISDWQQAIVPSSDRLSFWESTPWNPQTPRVYSSITHDDRTDPNLINAAESVPSGSRSPDLSTPSIAHNMETPYSTEQGLTTPQFTGNSTNSTYPNGSVPMVSGTGTIFDTSAWTGLEDSTFGNGTFNCAWAECQLPFSNLEEWASHLHQVHVDPQMSFDCPLQSDTCPQTLTSHPLDHLEAAHGFDFTYNNYICPAPACLENEIFCNPAMLHNHFDQAHAIPARGSLYCHWNDCNSSFTDQRELLCHLTSDHRLIKPIKDQSGRESGPQPDSIDFPAEIPDEELSETESNSPCLWNMGSGRCTVVCENPKELQEHINERHLKDLNKSTGYFCQWENCNRKKMGDKAGFSQRGKLVRHMQTHTICEF